MPRSAQRPSASNAASFVAEVVHCHVCHSRYLDRPGELNNCPACGVAQKPARAVVERAGRLERQ